MRPFPFAMTDEAKDFLLWSMRVLVQVQAPGEGPLLFEFNPRSGPPADPDVIETFGICSSPFPLAASPLETFDLEGQPIHVDHSLHERYRGRLLTVAPKFEGTVQALYFL